MVSFYELRSGAFFDRLNIVELLAARVASNILLHCFMTSLVCILNKEIFNNVEKQIGFANILNILKVADQFNTDVPKP